MQETYAVGVDFGTESGRALVVRVSDGLELGSAVTEYRSGVIDRELSGQPLPQGWALQDPEDYLEVFRRAVPEALRRSGVDPASVIGIGIDFTSCTILPTRADGTPLCRLPQFRGNPHAWVKLWKHHAAQPQADRLNALAAERAEAWLGRYGGKLSSQWLLAKSLQVLEEAPEVYRAAERILEAGDWVVWQLCGRELRSACPAGYKAAYQGGRYPSAEFLGSLHPDFAGLPAKLQADPAPLGSRAGGLSAEAAAWTTLPPGTPVAVANVDAHATVPAAGVVEPGRMVAIMGTSTCHMVLSERLAEIPGMCGVVDGGIIPGLYGYEAGQSGVGDIFAWAVRNAAPAEFTAAGMEAAHAALEREAAAQRPGEHGLLALDWINGNRSVLVDAELSGVILGLTLASRAPDIYRALIEATAYGTRVIVEAFRRGGVPVEEYVVAGGLKRNQLLMQIYADVLGMPLSVNTSEQGPALGSAMHAAVAAGAYPDIRAAARRMGKVERGVYQPVPAHRSVYDQLYREYLTLHDYFGRGGNPVMKRLRRLAAGQAVR